jgi:hypothetical protein
MISRHFTFIIGPFQEYIEAEAHEYLLPEARYLVPTVANVRVDMGKVVNWAKRPCTEDANKGEDPDVLERFLEVLPQAISNVTGLKCLAIEFSARWKTGLGQRENVAPMICFRMMDQLRIGLSSLFYAPTAWAETLIDLRLALPCAYDFAVIGDTIPDNMLFRLRHLRLQVIDGTGPWGCREYPTHYLERSRFLKEYLNEGYESAMVKIINKCKQLCTLGLSGTQHLDYNTIDWQPSDGGLETIHLQRIALSSESLITLLSPALEFVDRPSLFSAWIEEVRLTAGTWAEVFAHMRKCPSLRYTNMHQLDYDEEGESRHMRSTISRGSMAYEKIRTREKEDRKEMRNLMKYVIALSGRYPDEFDEMEVWDDYDSDGSDRFVRDELTEGEISGFS